MLTADAEREILEACGAACTDRKDRMHADEQRRYLDFAWRTAVLAGDGHPAAFPAAVAIEDKRNFMGYDPVTVADRAAEDVIRDAIKADVSGPRHPRRGARTRGRHVAAARG